MFFDKLMAILILSLGIGAVSESVHAMTLIPGAFNNLPITTNRVIASNDPCAQAGSDEYSACVAEGGQE